MSPFVTSASSLVTDDGRLEDSFALDGAARREMWKAVRDGMASSVCGEEICTRAYGIEQRPEVIEAYCLFELLEQRFIVGHAAVRNFDHFGSVSASELVIDLAVANTGDRLERFRRGRFIPMDIEGVKAIRRKTKGWSRQGAPCSDLPFRLVNGVLT